MFYTYLHCKPDGMPFYVGKGSEAIGYKKVPRYKDFTHGRNKHHRHIVEKYGRENIKIFVFECDSEERAFADEIQQIAQLRREGYKLSNLADGGEGATGYRHTEEARKRIGKASKGNKYCLGIKLTDEQRKLRSVNGRGRKISDKQKQQVSAVHKGKILSEETKKKISLSKSGKKWSEARWTAYRAKYSILKKGN